MPAKDISDILCRDSMSLNQLQEFLCALRTYCNHFLQCPLSPGPHPSSLGSVHGLCPAACSCSPHEAQAVPTAQSWFCGYPAVTYQPLPSTCSSLTASLLLSRICSAVTSRTADPQHPAYLNLPGLSVHWLPAELPHPAKAQPLLSFIDEPRGFYNLRKCIFRKSK